MEAKERNNPEYLDMLLRNSTLDLYGILCHLDQGDFKCIAFPPEWKKDQIILYAAPVIFLIGLVGHLMSLLILPYFAKKGSSYVYLLFLSIFDLLVLHVGLLVRWLNEILEMDILSYNNYTCKTLTFFSLVFSDTSVWLVVVVSFERFLLLCHPYQATIICRVRRSLKIILFMVILIAMVNSHVFWTLKIVINNETNQQRCDSASENSALIYQIWPLIDVLIYFILPFISACVFNYKIIQRIRRIRGRSHLVNTRRFLNGRVHHKSPKAERKLTVTMVILSLTFLVTTLPMLIYLCVTVVLNSLSNQPMFSHERYQHFRSIAEIFMYCNHAINFYLYIATSKRLRLGFQKRICQRKVEHLVVGHEMLEMQDWSSRYS